MISREPADTAFRRYGAQLRLFISRYISSDETSEDILQDIPFSQINEATGVPINTLISRKRYAVQYLRNSLKSIYSIDGE
ncbi:MAG: hypothetical protein SNH13_06775 [Rikenellaceae bacterium]